MRKIPVYISFGGMYVIILIGLFRYYNAYKVIEPIIPSQESRTIVPIPILIIASVFLFIILLSGAAQILVTFWTYLKEHKTMIVYPFLLIGLGFLQLAISIMLVVKRMIETNAIQFMNNLGSYITSTETLMNWILAGIVVGLLGLLYEVYLRYAQPQA